MKISQIKKIKIFTVAIFLILLILGIFTWACYFKNINKSTDITKNNQQTHTKKSFIDDIDSRISVFETEWYESILKKKYLCMVDSIFTYITTGEISSKEVFKGEGNWLFYKTKTDGDPVADFTGENSFSEKQKNNIIKKVKKIQKDLQKQGIKFMLYIPANKERIYYEKIPKEYNHVNKSRTDLLVEEMKKNDINVVESKESLIKEKNINQIFYKYDSHWNKLGAYIGVYEALKKWDINMKPYNNRFLDDTTTKAKFDLVDMAGLNIFFNKDYNPVLIDNKSDYNGSCSNPGMFHYTNKKAVINKSVLLIGDSFRESMLPALGYEFQELYTIHRNDFKFSDLKFKPDYIMLQYVERYTGELEAVDNMFK